MYKDNKGMFFTSNLTYMILAYAFIGVSILMTKLQVSIHVHLLVGQILIILLPAFIIMKFKNQNIRRKFRFNKISIKTAIYAILITILVLPLAYTLNFTMVYILIKLNLYTFKELPIDDISTNLYGLVAFIALTPAICEEVFFRGFIFSSFSEKLTPKKAMVLSGIMFGLFHFDVQNLMLPIVLGIVFAWMVYISDSILPSMIGHFVFNSIGAILMFTSKDVGETGSISDSISFIESNGSLYILVGLIMSVIFVFIVSFVMKKFKNNFNDIKSGYPIVINEDRMDITKVEKHRIFVMYHGEEKKIKNESLDELDYYIDKDDKEYSNWNIIFILSVVILFVFVGFL